MDRLSVLAAFIIGLVNLEISARAEELSPQYTPHEQTAEERLQNFQTPAPSPPQQTPLDRAADTYNNLPIRPSYDINSKAPIVQYQKKY